MSGDYQLEDTVYLPFTTRAFATGIPTALASGAVEIYEDSGITQITAAETLTVSLDTIAGFNMVAVAATAANGFEVGKSYTCILSAGTVDSVSVIGEVVGHFTIDMSAAALDLANGTDGLGALRTLLLDIPTVSEFNARTLVAASYFDPTTDTVATVTNLTGHIAQTGDTYALANGATGFAAIDTVVDAILAMLDDPRGEPAQGAPGVSVDLATKIDFIYKLLRNKKDQDGVLTQYYNDAGTVVDHKATTSEVGGLVTSEEIVSGP